MLSLLTIVAGLLCLIVLALGGLALFMTLVANRSDGVGKARQDWIEGNSTNDET